MCWSRASAKFLFTVAVLAFSAAPSFSAEKSESKPKKKSSATKKTEPVTALPEPKSTALTPDSDGSLDRIVAVINGAVILRTELRERSDQTRREVQKQKPTEPLLPPKEMDQKVLDQMINEILITSEIERRGYTATSSTIDGAVASVMRQNHVDSMEDFRKMLRDEGMSIEDYRATLKKQIENSRLINEVIRPRVSITDEDISAAYRRKLADENRQWRYKIRMIFKKKAKEGNVRGVMDALRKKIVAGTSFQSVADEETEGAGKGDGGLIGEISPTDLQPELAKAIEKLSPNDISPVVESETGYYLVQVLEKSASTKSPPPEVREQLREELTRDESSRQFESFVRSLRDKAQVQVLL